VADEKKDQEDLDRELIELLNELRVALPGVQVLFAFLLAVPFANGWKNVDGAEKAAFFVAFLATTVASALLIAPSAFHRLEWRNKDKEHLLEISNRLTIAGMGFLALAICSAVFLIADYIYNPWLAIVLTALALVLYGGLWYVVPLVRRARRK
jgi:membrane protein YdbS with pleckstrin-like domain